MASLERLPVDPLAHDSAPRPAETRRAVTALALYAMIAGLITIAGWVFNIPILTDWQGTGIAMYGNTGIASVAAAGALLCLCYGRRRPALALGGFAGLIGLATLIEHASGVSLGIDTLVFQTHWGFRSNMTPGRMGSPAALSFALTAIAAVFLTRSPGTRAAPIIGMVIVAIGSLSITGYLFGADPLFATPRLTGISFQTSTILLALGLALVALVPERRPMRTLLDPSGAGVLVRRALPFLLMVPLVLGWLCTKGEERGLFGTGIGTAFLVLALVLMLISLLWWAAAAVRTHEDAVRERDNLFRTMFDVSSVGMAKADPADATLVRVNQTFADMIGYDQADIIGRTFLEFTHPDDCHPNIDLFHKMIRGEISTYHVEKRFIRSDGGIVWADVTANLVKDHAGRPLRTVAVVKDITQRVRDEQAIKARAREQEVLYQFTDRLCHAGELPDIYDAALDAILSAMECRRASILLFDEDDALRFVAWRGLSDGYRGGAAALSPWTPATPDPQPVTITDITAADLSEPLLALVAAEGIRSLALIPLVASSRVIGMFMACHEAPHRFSQHELALATTLARQLAFGIERARAEQALRKSEERLRLATNAGKIGLWEWDVPTNRVVWTESLYAIHGVSHSEFAETVEGFSSLVHPEDKSSVSAAIQRALSGEAPYELEFRAVKPNGQLIWIYTTAVVIRDGGKPVRMIGAALDITERKAAQRALSDSELLFRTLGEAVPDFLWMTDDRGNPIYQNPAWRQFTGLSTEDIVENGWDAIIHPDELPIMRRLWNDAISNGQPFDFEGRLRRHDGEYRWFMGRTVPVKNDQGAITRWVGTLTDIEDRKRLERDRDEHAADLALALADRTEQVTRVQQRLAANDRLAAVGTLAAGLGHDLSNLLLPLTVRLEGLLVRRDLPEDARSDIQAADALIGHIRALARNLRMFVRDPHQTGPEQFTELHEWVQRVQRFLGVIAGGIEGGDTHLEYDVPAGLPLVAIAPHQLTQALTNLVHNAREAIATRRAATPSDPGQGRICITACVAPEGPEVRVIVSDDGAGMTDDIRRRCLEPFFTTKDRATESARAGTGIGLATVHAAIAHAGGRIDIDSKSGCGTTFTLHLPTAASRAHRPPFARASRAPRIEPKPGPRPGVPTNQPS
jgi:PAS domain S-box-containing protein